MQNATKLFPQQLGTVAERLSLLHTTGVEVKQLGTLGNSQGAGVRRQNSASQQ